MISEAYDRFITIWLENTDYSSAAAQSAFQQLAAQGILLTNYNGVTHPSEPNYVAASESPSRALLSPLWEFFAEALCLLSGRRLLRHGRRRPVRAPVQRV